MSGLNIGTGTRLPDEAVTETFAMLAKRGTGKSNAAVVMAEEMTDADHQWVAIDPKGDWYGIRASADGKGPGLSVPVFGGRHGDLPLEATAGTLLAKLVVERDLTVVLDVSLFSKADQIRFVTDFAETLFRSTGDSPRPLHLFLEEAEEFLPQRVDARSARMVGAYSKIAKQGRVSGLGVSLITQRSASLNKDALSQTDTLILFRTVSPHDRKAVVAWAEHHDEAKDVASSLAELKPGESWILSPGFLGSIEKVQWRRRRTFDSGATPLTGKARRKDPVSLADIDLAEIRELMADTVERAKADDPKELRKQIASLKRELAARPEAEPEKIEVVVAVDKPFVPTGVIDALKLIEESVSATAENVRSALAAAADVPTAPAPERKSKPARTQAPATRSRPAAAPVVADPTFNGELKLGKGEKTVLGVLAEYPEGRTYNEVAFLAGYSANASTLGVILSNLRKQGLVEPGNQPVRATTEGIDAAGGVRERPTGPDLLDHWLGHKRMGEGERRVLKVLVDEYPTELTHEELCEATGYSPDASTIGVILSKLRKLGLVEKRARRIAPEFAEAIS